LHGHRSPIRKLLAIGQLLPGERETTRWPGAKEVDAAKATANLKNWSYAAVNAIASEVANIQFRL
jgi:hypothetical protein